MQVIKLFTAAVLSLFIFVAAGVAPGFAQEAPPVLLTNVVRFTESTEVQWKANAEPDIHGYWVRLSQGTNTWEKYTTKTNVTLATISPDIQPGTNTVRVSAVNQAGLEGLPGVLTTNLVKPPVRVVEVRFITSVTATEAP